MKSFQNKTIIITGASRGIGREMALKFAAEGANIVVAAKTSDPHPKLEGTIHTVAAEIEEVGGKALAIQIDVREEAQVKDMAAQAAEKFGGIDALINNAGAIRLSGVEHLPVKRFDLMMQINARAVFLCSQAVLPYLKKSSNAHILNLSPPINLDPKWLKDYSPYTLSKYGMSLLTIGMAEEFRDDKISVNALWPKTLITTAAVEFELGGKENFKLGRKPSIVADAAHAILSSQPGELSGQTLIDEDILRQRGVTDFDVYAYEPGTKEFMPDLFVD